MEFADIIGRADLRQGPSWLRTTPFIHLEAQTSLVSHNRAAHDAKIVVARHDGISGNGIFEVPELPRQVIGRGSLFSFQWCGTLLPSTEP